MPDVDFTPALEEFYKRRRERMKDAFTAAEIRLKAVRQEVVNFIDAGAHGDHAIVVKQRDLIRWFDNLECVSGLIRSAALNAEE